MSILFISFVQAGGEMQAEYEASGEDARRLAAIAGHPGAVKVIRANVTFFHEVLDDESIDRRIKEGADEARRELADQSFAQRTLL